MAVRPPEAARARPRRPPEAWSRDAAIDRPSPLPRSAGRRRPAPEGALGAGEFLVRHARPFVRDADVDVLPGDVHGAGDGGAGRARLDRVVEQDVQGVFQRAVHLQGRRGGPGEVETDALDLGGHAPGVDPGGGGVEDLDGSGCGPGPPGGAPVEDLVQQREQAVHFPQHAREFGDVGPVLPQHLQTQPDRGQRSAQLVGGGGRQTVRAAGR